MSLNILSTVIERCDINESLICNPPLRITKGVTSRDRHFCQKTLFSIHLYAYTGNFNPAIKIKKMFVTKKLSVYW